MSAELNQAWQRVTAPGQVKVGTKIRFMLGDELRHETAKLILHAGTDKEEVIYNKRQNWYFITSMAMAGTGSQKNIEFLANSKGASPANTAEATGERAFPTDAELADPEYMLAYVEEMFAALAELAARPSAISEAEAGDKPVRKAVETAPKEIWLQISDCDEHMDEPFPEFHFGDVTWCADSVTEAQVHYIRADLAPTHTAAVQAALKRVLAIVRHEVEGGRNDGDPVWADCAEFIEGEILAIKPEDVLEGGK